MATLDTFDLGRKCEQKGRCPKKNGELKKLVSGHLTLPNCDEVGNVACRMDSGKRFATPSNHYGAYFNLIRYFNTAARM